jgi:hypothetical protein
MHNLKCYYDYVNKYLFNHLDMNSLSVHDRVTSSRVESCSYETSLIPPLFIQVLSPSPERQLSCICVLGVSILPISANLIFDFGIVPSKCIFGFYFITQEFVHVLIFRSRQSWYLQSQSNLVISNHGRFNRLFEPWKVVSIARNMEGRLDCSSNEKCLRLLEQWKVVRLLKLWKIA